MHHPEDALGPVRPGDITGYRDMNRFDGKIDANDMTRIGNGDVPNLTYGAGVNVVWKQWNIGIFFQGIRGADRQLGGDGIFPFNNSTGAERSNLYSARRRNRWTPSKSQSACILSAPGIWSGCQQQQRRRELLVGKEYRLPAIENGGFRVHFA